MKSLREHLSNLFTSETLRLAISSLAIGLSCKILSMVLACSGMGIWINIILEDPVKGSCREPGTHTHWSWYEVLFRRYCSVATVACISYLDYIPVTLFGASCRCNFIVRPCRSS